MRLFAIFTLIILHLTSLAKISQNASKQLPDLRLEDIYKPSFVETKKHLSYSACIKCDTRKDYNPIELLRQRFLPLIKSLCVNTVIVKQAHIITQYRNSRYTSLEIKTKNNLLHSLQKNMKRHPENNNKKIAGHNSCRAGYFRIKEVLYITVGLCSEGHTNMHNYLRIYKKRAESRHFYNLHSTLTYFHYCQSIYPQIIVYLGRIPRHTTDYTSAELTRIAKIVVCVSFTFCYNYIITCTQKQNGHAVGNRMYKLLQALTLKHASTAFSILTDYHQRKRTPILSFTDSPITPVPVPYKVIQNTKETDRRKTNILTELYKADNTPLNDFDIRLLEKENKRNKQIALEACLFLCFVILIFSIRCWNNQKKTEALSNQLEEFMQLQTLRIEDEKEKERKRIGQELHDGLSTTIAAGVRFLRMMAENESETDSKAFISAISDMLERDYNKARGKSHELYLEENDENFWERIANNINLFFVGIPMRVIFNHKTSGLLLTHDEKTTIQLVIRESITNVIRHSKATQVEVLIFTEAKNLVINVNDNGLGIPSRTVQTNVGIKSISERIQNLDGTMTIQANYPHGTNLTAKIPITNQSFAYQA